MQAFQLLPEADAATGSREDATCWLSIFCTWCLDAMHAGLRDAAVGWKSYPGMLQFNVLIQISTTTTTAAGVPAQNFANDNLAHRSLQLLDTLGETW